MCLSGVPHHTKCLSLVVFLSYKHVLNILQVVSFGTLLSYPSACSFGGGVLICVCQRYPSTQNVCNWLFLTYRNVLKILQVVSFGTLLSYTSLLWGVGY